MKVKMEKINVIYVEPGKKSRAIEIKYELSEMQNLVGIYSEDGKLMDIIAGSFFIAYAPVESERFLSLPKDLEEKYAEKFKHPEQFFWTPNGIKVVKCDPIASREQTPEQR